MTTTLSSGVKTCIITISEKAKKELIACMKEEKLDPRKDYIRIGVHPGGCSGLSYELAFEKADKTQLNLEEDEVYVIDNSKKEIEDEGYFSDNENSDNKEKGNSGSGIINLLINKASKLYLAGSTLDYAGGLNGRGFYFSNPNAKRTCGCGESFSS